MITFMEEMKQQFQSIRKNLRERGQPRQKVASKLKRQFSNELKGVTFQEASKFHRSPMQAEVRYLSPHRRDGGTLENVAREIPNAAMAIAPHMIFAQTNPLTQPRAYEGGFSFNGGSRGIRQLPVGVNGNRGQQIHQLVT